MGAVDRPPAPSLPQRYYGVSQLPKNVDLFLVRMQCFSFIRGFHRIVKAVGRAGPSDKTGGHC